MELKKESLAALKFSRLQKRQVSQMLAQDDPVTVVFRVIDLPGATL
jgi:hypothetical protein